MDLQHNKNLVDTARSTDDDVFAQGITSSITGAPLSARSKCDSCGKLCKNDKGVKIHQGKSRDCQKIKMQRIQIESRCKTGEVSSPDAHHSAPDNRASATRDALPDSVITPGNESKDSKRRPRIAWPPATDKRWKSLDTDLDIILEANLRGTASKKVEAMTRIVYEVCVERFGEKSSKKENPPASGPSRRQQEIASLRRELRQLRNQWKYAPDCERDGLKALRDDIRLKLASLRRAENTRKRQKAKRRDRTAFFEGPYRFVSNLLGKPKSGSLKCPIEEVEESISSAHSDPDRNEPLGERPIKITVDDPTTPFNTEQFKYSEIESIVKKARSAAAPGPSGLSYALYKHCPKLTRRLWKLCNGIWRSKTLPATWTMAEGCFVPKELNSSSIDQFREISLLDVEGKIFWAATAKL